MKFLAIFVLICGLVIADRNLIFNISQYFLSLQKNFSSYTKKHS